MEVNTKWLKFLKLVNSALGDVYRLVCCTKNMAVRLVKPSGNWLHLSFLYFVGHFP